MTTGDSLMDAERRPDVYTNEYEPWFGVLVADATEERARRAVEAEYDSGLPIRYLGIRTEPILHENGRPGRKRRFHVFTDEPTAEDSDGR